MTWCVVISRQSHRSPIVLGPFRDEHRAQRKADSIANALAARGLYYVVEVEPLYVGATAASEIVEAAA